MQIKASLAPMAGFTDCAFRRLVSKFGAAYTVSEMVSAVALTMNDRKTGELARISEGESPVFIQIFGHDPKIMAKAADIILSGSFNGCSYASPPAGIDINMGCPVKKITSNGDGSALMRDPELCGRITAEVAEVCSAHGVPLSVKIRSGWDKNSVNAPEIAQILAKNGASKITLHCRTKEQMYSPSADPSVARSVRLALDEAGFSNTPLVGNGDVDSLSAAEEYISAGCAEVAVGRAALGSPWIFAELSAEGGFTPPTRDEIVELAVSLVEDIVRDKGESVGIRESRGRAAHFIKGMRGSAEIRDKLNHAESLAEFTRILTSWR